MKPLVYSLLLFLSYILLFTENGVYAIQKIKPKRREVETEEKAHQSKHWGYRNQDKSLLPKEWHKSHPKCNGIQQSPINVNFSASVFDSKLKSICISSLINSNKTTTDVVDGPYEEHWKMGNNGHSGN
jgi:carbonic anhydrase